MTKEKAPHKGVAVVIGVGAETGLGAALARRFAREGLRVTIAGRTLDRLRAVAEFDYDELATRLDTALQAAEG